MDKSIKLGLERDFCVADNWWAGWYQTRCSTSPQAAWTPWYPSAVFDWGAVDVNCRGGVQRHYTTCICLLNTVAKLTAERLGATNHSKTVAVKSGAAYGEIMGLKLHYTYKKCKSELKVEQIGQLCKLNDVHPILYDYRVNKIYLF